MDEFILNALREDMPNGDITTDNIIPCDEVSHARKESVGCHYRID